jgi:hypothetical protein
MRIVRDRPEARWLPSRFTFAVFRLMALLRMLGAKRQEPRKLILAIDAGQSAFENYLVSTWVSLTVACYMAAWLRHFIPLVFGFLAGVVLSGWLLQLPLFVIGIWLPRSRNNQRVISIATFVILVGISAYMATLDGRVHFVAALFLGIMALNAMAAVAMFFLRGRVKVMEKACGL